MFTKKEITERIVRQPKWQHMARLIDSEQPFCMVASSESFQAFAVALLHEITGRNFLVICPNGEASDIFYANIKTFAPHARYFPERELHLPPGQTVEEKEIERIGLLSRMGEGKLLVITNVSALSLLLPSRKAVTGSVIELFPGADISRDALLRTLLASGYEEAEIVENQGEFARRGGIVDYFPFEDAPVRVEFAADRVGSIRIFDPATQLSIRKQNMAKVLPLSEDYVCGDRDSTFFDHFVEKPVIFVSDPDAAVAEYAKIPERINSGLKQFLAGDRVLQEFSKASTLATDFGRSKTATKIHFAVDKPGRFGLFGGKFLWQKFDGEEVFVVEENRTHLDGLKKILAAHNVLIPDSNIIIGYLSSSFAEPESGITLISSRTLLGAAEGKPGKFFTESVPILRREELKAGDYIVHYQEGIGKFVGFEKIRKDDEEFIVLEYARGEKLYLPVSQIDFIHRYIGTNPAPMLSTLGSTSWIKVRDLVRNEIRALADELSKLYLERKKQHGFSYPDDDEMEQELEESFPYEETQDQLRAIDEIKKDLQSEQIMDRLLCGDSGYGKTEVALRAAMKVVKAGKQVALLCPTTVLVQQHLRTFRERLARFPVTVEMLSRLHPARIQRDILRRLAVGAVDILIGTHRMLGKDVIFKDLGLLIIDEEQRFGVLHKEKLKGEFRRVEVLTLSATPIPRTLYFSLAGIRDLSILETPPVGRLSVTTYLGKYDPGIIRRAISVELERAGQVFYLHNRIYDILKVKNMLEGMFPGIPIGVAHGRMKERELAAVMDEFAAGSIKILVATSIVENGLDIPNANTLIVDNAHKFGLSDLYQLRGRVGRYKLRAYAYLLIPPHIFVTRQAKERLQTINELTKPGSGFKIAMRDLQIRGAGDILGKRQSGFINQVGFNLYCRFWQEVSAKYTGKTVQQPAEKPQMRGVIDDVWLPSPGLRFNLYQEISGIRTREEAENLIRELEDRFGEIPGELEQLIFSQIAES